MHYIRLIDFIIYKIALSQYGFLWPTVLQVLKSETNLQTFKYALDNSKFN